MQKKNAVAVNDTDGMMRKVLCGRWLICFMGIALGRTGSSLPDEETEPQ